MQNNGLSTSLQGQKKVYRDENGACGVKFHFWVPTKFRCKCRKKLNLFFLKKAPLVNLQDKIPDFVTNKRNNVRLILFTAAFALLFINFYAPFGAQYWFNVTKLQFFFYSSLTILTGVLVVGIGRVLMLLVCKRFRLNYYQYFTWVLAEILFMSLFYVLFEIFVIDENRDFFELMRISVLNTALVLLLPYSAMWLYFSYHEKKEALERLSRGEALPDISKNMIPFHDEKGVLRFSVKAENLLYLESSDNYVNICYLNKEKVSTFMLRNTLKKMEDLFVKSEVVRCHRSYMVNFAKVKVIRKDKDGLQLELDHPSAIDIPVSRSYVDNVMATFSKYSTSV
jgi:hypothetical protein